MKKIMILATAILLFASNADAQLKYGVKLGANVTGMKTESVTLDKSAPSLNYQFGVLMQYKLWLFSFQPEIIFSQKGAKLQDATRSTVLSSASGNAEELDYRSQYVEIPLNIQFGYTFGKVRYMILGGPYVSFLTGGTINGERDIFNTVNDEFKFNRVDFGMGAGAGAEYKKYQLQVKYDFGMLQAGKEDALIQTELINPFYKMRNRNLSVSLAYLF